MNWLVWTLKILSVVPGVVMGIERMTTGVKQGATKKELAMTALGLSYGTASAVLPEHKEAIEAATVLAGNAIDNFVALQNAISHPAFKPAPVPVPALLPEAPATAFGAIAGPVSELNAAPAVEGLHQVVPA